MDEHPLTEAQIDAIAERAARRTIQIIDAEIGQNVRKKLAWLTVVVLLGLAIWLAGKNSLPLNQ
jgi:hypothetical protein